MTKPKATNYFRTEPEKLNCAQSILKVFQVPDNVVAKFRKYGGGRAPEGICGALFSADYLLKQQGKNSIQEEFRAKAGAILCRELRKTKTLCESRVNIADELLTEKLTDF